MRQPHDVNRQAWDERVRRKASHTLPVTRAELANPYAIIDDLGWLGGNVRGRRVLCLAAGGGRHGVLFAAAGAIVTVVDLSPQMLELDRERAAEFGLAVRTVETSMDDLSALGNAAFDLVIQPVSTCYVPDVVATYREIARVSADQALYISQHKQPGTLQAELLPGPRGYVMSASYYRTEPLPEVLAECQHREMGTVEYLHRWQDLLGGLCRAGFVIEDLVEPRHANPTAEPGTFGHRACFLPPFVTLKARRIARAEESLAAPSTGSRLWIPGRA
jgi:SAM-dependent methyltransferase